MESKGHDVEGLERMSLLPEDDKADQQLVCRDLLASAAQFETPPDIAE